MEARRPARWTTRKDLAEEYGFSTRTIDRRIREINKLIGIRYPHGIIIREPRVRIRTDVARDYMEHGSAIRRGAAPAFKGGDTWK